MNNNSNPAWRIEKPLQNLKDPSLHLQQFMVCFEEMSPKARNELALMIEKFRDATGCGVQHRRMSITGTCELLTALIKTGMLR